MPVVHNGMILIKPSSVNVTGAGSSATINSSGSVTFSTAATLSLNGVFSSTYDNYVIDIRHLASSTDNFEYRLRLSGSDNSTSNSYVSQLINANGSTVSGSRTTSTIGRLSIVSDGQRSGDQVFLYGPALAQPTAVRAVSASGNSSARIYDHASTHNQSTAYDGITLIPSALTFGGLVKVYGLRQ
jgi:hypothetical protein